MPDDDYALMMRRRTYFLHNLFWFWPTVKSDDDVQRVTVLGYWVCMSLAVLNLYKGINEYLLANAVAKHWNVALVLAEFLIFYVLGANGLRCRSVSAAVMVVTFQVVDLAEEHIQLGRFPLDTTSELILLLIVLRGIYLASRWEATHERTEPLLNKAFFGHALVDRWPQVIWPRLRVLFWLAAASITGPFLFYFYLAYQDPQVR